MTSQYSVSVVGTGLALLTCSVARPRLRQAAVHMPIWWLDQRARLCGRRARLSEEHADVYLLVGSGWNVHAKLMRICRAIDYMHVK